MLIRKKMHLSYFAFLSFLLVGFQNCSPTGFQGVSSQSQTKTGPLEVRSTASQGSINSIAATNSNILQSSSSATSAAAASIAASQPSSSVISGAAANSNSAQSANIQVVKQPVASSAPAVSILLQNPLIPNAENPIQIRFKSNGEFVDHVKVGASYQFILYVHSSVDFVTFSTEIFAYGRNQFNTEYINSPRLVASGQSVLSNGGDDGRPDDLLQIWVRGKQLALDGKSAAQTSENWSFVSENLIASTELSTLVHAIAWHGLTYLPDHNPLKAVEASLKVDLTISKCTLSGRGWSFGGKMIFGPVSYSYQQDHGVSCQNYCGSIGAASWTVVTAISCMCGTEKSIFQPEQLDNFNGGSCQ